MAPGGSPSAAMASRAAARPGVLVQAPANSPAVTPAESPSTRPSSNASPPALPTTSTESSSRRLPWLFNDPKKRLPTPSPTQYTNSAVPMPVIPSGTCSPKCPAAKAANSTPELPSEIPRTEICPRSSPTARIPNKTNNGCSSKLLIISCMVRSGRASTTLPHFLQETLTAQAHT